LHTDVILVVFYDVHKHYLPVYSLFVLWSETFVKPPNTVGIFCLVQFLVTKKECWLQ